MSTAYWLVCLDTGEVLSLGPSFVRDRGTLKERWMLTGLTWSPDPITGSHDRHNNYIDALAHFLIRNRGMEIRLINDRLTPQTNEFPIDWDTILPTEPHELAKLLAKPVGLVNYENDGKCLDQKIVERLKELARGENIKRLPWDEPGDKDKAKS